MSKFFYYKLKRMNWVTETDKYKPDNHYISPGQLEGTDYYQQISQPTLKFVFWINMKLKKIRQRKQNKNCKYKDELIKLQLDMRPNIQWSSLPHKENIYAKNYFPTDTQ